MPQCAASVAGMRCPNKCDSAPKYIGSKCVEHRSELSTGNVIRRLDDPAIRRLRKGSAKIGQGAFGAEDSLLAQLYADWRMWWVKRAERRLAVQGSDFN
jgi:hypothetical protein